MRICHIVAGLAERFGGPSKSVLALARATAELGHDVELLSTDDAANSEHTEGRLRIRIFRRARPSFLARSPALARHLAQLTPDVLHHHALWQRPLHYAAEFAADRGIPLVTSPRGMMSPWAWHHHRWRKQLARSVVHPGALERTTGWHATSEEESADIRNLGFAQPQCVAPNGVVAPGDAEMAGAAAHWRTLCPALAHTKTALFYSRFHRKKRVLELIDLWLEHAPADWCLLMAGLPDDYTAGQLETYVLRASGNGRVRVYDGEHHPAPYAVASLFLLPSHSENFGMAIAEAMAHGLPVVVTDSTPWQAVNAEAAGWCVPWSEYLPALLTALAETGEARAQRGARARRYVTAGFSWARTAQRLVDFYAQLGAAHR